MTFRANWKYATFILGIFIYLVLFLSPNHALVKGHTGWVTSHNLAIANHTTAETGYVGYTEVRSKDDNKEYVYFARSPIFTYFLIKLSAESFSKNKIDEIISSRVFMRAVFVLLIYLSFIMLLKISNSNFWLAAGVTLGVFSSQYFLIYKDLVSPDMFTNLGFIVCIWGIYFYEKQRHILGFLLIFLSLNLGWGYSVLPLLGIWSVWQFFSERKWSHVFNKKLVIFIFSILVVAGNIIYNCYQEAKVNNVSILETDILQSAGTRLALNQSFNESLNYPYYRYIFKLIDRFYRGFALPYADWSMVVTALPFLIFIIFGNYKFYKRRQFKKEFKGLSRMILLFLPLFSLLWALIMKNLFVPHGYTSMNLFGISLCLMYLASLGLFITVSSQKYFFYTVLFYFVTVHGYTNYKDSQLGKEREKLVEEYANIAHFLGTDKQKICVENEREILGGVPYSAHFFLSAHIIEDGDSCAYKISKDTSHSSRNLVSTNQFLFLTKVSNE